MHIGDKLRRSPSVQIYDREKGPPPTLPCRVVYIHPQRRFYSVEFQIAGRCFREAFYFPDRLGDLYQTERNLKYENDCDYE